MCSGITVYLIHFVVNCVCVCRRTMLDTFKKMKIKNLEKTLIVLLIVFAVLCFRATYRRRILAKLTVEGWDQNTLRNTSLYVFPNQSTTIFSPNRFCIQRSSLLVIVTSAPENAEKRQAIRESWGSTKNVSNFNIDIYFLIGIPPRARFQAQIDQEFLAYDDLIQEQFTDVYYNLTLKSVMMLKLIESQCLNKIKYILKTDDDMYINIKALTRVLKEIRQTDLLMGYLYAHVHPIRDELSKWYTPYYLYSKKYFPNFLSGTAYVMSANVVPKLYSAALQTPLLHLEDVYITGILPEKVGIEVKHHEGFSRHKRAFDPCVFLTAITSHGHSGEEIRKLHSLIHKTDLKRSCDEYEWQRYLAIF